MMDPKRYRQVRQVFDEAMGVDASARPAFLASVESSLRADVERLLAASERATGVFVDASAATVTLEPSERWEGRRLGPYEILHELGEGGMGVVYLARRADGAFEKQVAIKVVRQSLATREFLARFQREREILAKLEHPNIARLLDGGSTPNGLAYLVMEYVKGEPLLAYADSRRLPYDNRLRLLRQIAEAVDYAHTQGVVHRDLKPSNIFVSSDGQVKLLDFGIASWQEDSIAREASAPTIALSPAYASPEQARGERTTKASDIYSFAIVAYELLAGVLPFQTASASLEQVLRTIAESTPLAPSVALRESRSPGQSEIGRLRRTPPSELVQLLEQTADGPLLAALSKHPQERPESAGVLIGQLEKQTDPDEQSTAWSLVRKELSSHSVAWMSLIVFVYLVWTEALILKPVAWVAVGISAAFYLVHRAGWLAWLGGNVLPWILLALAAFAGRLPFVLALLAIAGVWGFFYTRREHRLGERLYVSSDRRRAKLPWLLLAANVLVISSIIMEIDKPMRWNIPLMFLSQFASLPACLPVEVRRRGVVVQGRVIRWEEIESYRWPGGQTIAFQLKKSRLLAPGLEILGVVPVEDIPGIQAELRNWLRERPGYNLSISSTLSSDYD